MRALVLMPVAENFEAARRPADTERLEAVRRRVRSLLPTSERPDAARARQTRRQLMPALNPLEGNARRTWAGRVADSVTSHEAYGLGSYCFFNVNSSVVNARAFEVPVKSGVKFRDMVTVSLGGTGTITHVINNTGDTVNSGHQVTSIVTGP